jgi:hypothetical protein
MDAITRRIPTWTQDADEDLFPATPSRTPAWLAAVITERSLPPVQLRRKALPEWSGAERQAFEPAGMVWDRDRQEWTRG